ncbi:hypothetical protein [Ruminococcus albus]|uniref:Phosphorylase superfamily protein n=1 Tax=Ruminococcus albus TaxID=1264 RepID=A0A1I1JNP8_RUMAL|nr:hypothetical protein [Ruminococcus albus]SFC50096.1 hypothetical protein SAMN02910406_01818 [Ruminococcus albus]
MIIDSYDIKSEPIVNFEAFYSEKKHLVEICLVIFSKEIYEHLLSQYECKQIAEVSVCNGNIPIWSFQRNHRESAFYLTHIGSDRAGELTAEVNHLTGANKFIMFGSCGSLDNSITNGKFIIPSQGAATAPLNRCLICLVLVFIYFCGATQLKKETIFV